MNRGHLVALLILVWVSPGAIGQERALVPKDDASVVVLSAGTLKGVVERDVRAFKGIPYAAPPVGELRWRAPRPGSSWEGVRPATGYGASCIQPAVPPVLPEPYPPLRPEKSLSEDCLFLNVWAPVVAKKLPVMVSIHGGGFFMGSGSWDMSDGTMLARDGVVVVTINYRLGPLGFFAHPGLTIESGSGPATNFGLLDQIAALQWVKGNIAAFGGDPGKVTILGGSAGGISVNLLMISPLSAGLFQRAISSSGAFADLRMRHLAEPLPGQPESAEQWGTRLAAKLGAKDIQALRLVPAEKIFQTSLGMGVSPGQVIDGKSVPKEVDDAFRSGQQHRIPYLNGANEYEGGLLADRGPAWAEIETRLGSRRDAVLKTYDPEGKFGTEIVRRMIFGDTLVIRPTQELARDMLSVGLLGYTYVFAYVPKSVRSLTPGAWHGAEFNYFFGTLATRSAAQRAATAEDDSMSAKFRAYWVNFARTGRPDAAGGPEWGSARAGTMVFANDGPHFSREYLKTRLDVLGNAF